MKLYLDPGHGGTDPGAVGNGLQEKDVNLDIALKTRDILNAEYTGHKIKLSRTGDTTKSLKARTDEANKWGADYFLSIHVNAFNGSTNGYEDYIHDKLSNTGRTAQIRNIIHAEITKRVDFENRGKKKANFHVIRESHMPAMLSENGFIDNKEDAAKLKSASFIEKIARGHAVGIALAFKLPKKAQSKPKPKPDKDIYYRVVCGSFSNRSNAEVRQAALQNKGYDSFLDAFKDKGKTYYRVIVGSFQSHDNADQRVQELNTDGFSSFIAIYKK